LNENYKKEALYRLWMSHELRVVVALIMSPELIEMSLERGI